MACRLCLDYWGTTTCVVSSRPACTGSAEEPILVQRDSRRGGFDRAFAFGRAGAVLRGSIVQSFIERQGSAKFHADSRARDPRFRGTRKQQGNTESGQTALIDEVVHK